MTGQRKNEILPEISQAEEWFDLDRGGKVNVKTWLGIDPEPEPEPELKRGDEVAAGCPHCGSARATYEGKVVSGDDTIGTALSCYECATNYWQEP